PPWAISVYPSMPPLVTGCDMPGQLFPEESVLRCFLALSQRGIKPGPGKSPVAIRSAADDPQSPGRLVERESRKEPELDQLGTGRIFLGQFVQSVIEDQKPVRRFSEGEVEVFEA